MQTESTDTYTGFLKLFVPMQLTLRRFVFAHIPGFHQAEDTFQEIALALWKDFPRYDSSRPFEPWAFGVAWNLILKARRTAARDRHVFQDEVAEKITERLTSQSSLLDLRNRFLQSCLEKLSGDNQALLRMKYTERQRIEQIASALGRTPNAIRLVLFRVRVALGKCLEGAADNNPDAEEVAT
jgi:RNA polymerase sigma-70 factor (ECF subfamily)